MVNQVSLYLFASAQDESDTVEDSYASLSQIYELYVRSPAERSAIPNTANMRYAHAYKVRSDQTLDYVWRTLSLLI